METDPTISIEKHFTNIEDPRIDRTKRYKLIDILVLAICAVICGADNLEEEDVVKLFDDLDESGFKAYPFSQEQTVNKDHGRIETRTAWVIDDPKVLMHLRDALEWEGLRAELIRLHA